jgi:hypothetical protein
MMQKRLNAIQERLLDLNQPFDLKIFDGDIGLFDGDIRRISNNEFNRCNYSDGHTAEELNDFTQRIHEDGVHTLAYYVSPHISKKDFGIYFLESGISLLASYFENKINNNIIMNDMNELGQKTKYEIRKDLVKVAKKVLLRHELGHYAIDYSLTQCNTDNMINSNDYYKFKIESHEKHIALDESICNGNVARQSLKILNKITDRNSVEFSLNLHDFCNEFMDNQPFEYRGYGQFLPNYAKTSVNALIRSTGMDFSITDFREAIKDKSVMNIPLYMVSKQ